MAVRRLFENPVAAVSSFSNLGKSFSAPAGSAEKMQAVTCAFTRLNAVTWFAMFLTVLIGFYLACCWPCLNLTSLLIYFCCCCGLLRGRRTRAGGRRGGGGGGGEGASARGDGDVGAMMHRPPGALPSVAEMWMGAEPASRSKGREPSTSTRSRTTARGTYAPATVRMLRVGEGAEGVDGSDEEDW